MAPPLELLACGLVFLLGAGGYAGTLYFARRERNKRRLIRTPRTLAMELRPGVARVMGRAGRWRETLRAPASGRPCYAYELRVEVRSARGNWSEVLRLQDACAFLVIDESGHAQVEPRPHFHLVLGEDVAGSTFEFDRLPVDRSHEAAVRRLLHKNGIVTETYWLEKALHIRYHEGAVLEGEPVSVCGLAQVEVDPEGERSGPRAPPVTRVLRGTKSGPVLIGDVMASHAAAELV